MKNSICRILKYGTLISAWLLIGSVVLQIFARFFLENAPSWTEEASRLFFIYTVAFAAGLAFKDNYYVYLEIFFEKLTPKFQRTLLFIIPTCTAILFGIMTFCSIQFVKIGWIEKSPGMKISMSIAFMSMLILSLTVCYFSILEIIKTRKSL
ncbi:MAG: TRAP transporter small permease [Bacteroidota bacterium]